jgi:uracil-DNA glycosylase
VTVDRTLLARYLRQLGELGVDEVFLDTLSSRDALALLSGQASSQPPAAVKADPAARSATSGIAALREALAEPAAAAPADTRKGAAAGTAARKAGTGATTERAGSMSLPGALETLAVEAGACTRCRLHAERTTVVFGEGNPAADVVVVGEAPGQEEDRTGRPFVGRAGKLLDLLLMSVGLPRDSVYICNTLKCRPPGNRNPQADEVEACGAFLHGQLDAIKPKVLLAVGKFAAQALLQSEETIGRLRGVVHQYRGSPLIVTYHPAYLLRSPQMTRIAWQDFQLLRRVLDEQA